MNIYKKRINRIYKLIKNNIKIVCEKTYDELEFETDFNQMLKENAFNVAKLAIEMIAKQYNEINKKNHKTRKDFVNMFYIKVKEKDLEQFIESQMKLHWNQEINTLYLTVIDLF